jgi:wyosine [tRNA(Phe)-imidazoG37] synthetase (radical SAM superfamily)
MFEFALAYRRQLVTETMLVRTVNDSEDSLNKIADLFARLRFAMAYLFIPTRPPAEVGSQSHHEEIINRTYHILRERIEHVEYLIGYEGNDFYTRIHRLQKV